MKFVKGAQNWTPFRVKNFYFQSQPMTNSPFTASTVTV